MGRRAVCEWQRQREWRNKARLLPSPQCSRCLLRCQVTRERCLGAAQCMGSGQVQSTSAARRGRSGATMTVWSNGDGDGNGDKTCGTAAEETEGSRLAMRDHVPRPVPIRPLTSGTSNPACPGLEKMSHTTWLWLADLALSAIDELRRMS